MFTLKTPQNLQIPSNKNLQKTLKKPPKTSKTPKKTSKTPPKTSKFYKHRKIIDPDDLGK